MFQIVVRLEQSFSGVELDQDATDREHVAGEGPAEIWRSVEVKSQVVSEITVAVADYDDGRYRLTQDDLRRSVVSSTDHWRLVISLEGGATKVDQADVGVSEDMSMILAGALKETRYKHPAIQNPSSCEGLTLSPISLYLFSTSKMFSGFKSV